MVPTKRDAVSVTAAQSVVPGVAVLHQLLPADGEAHNADRKRQPGQQAERQGTDAVPTAAGVDRKDWFRPRSADRGEQAAEPGRLKATERTAEAATPERRRRTSRAARGAPDWTWRQLGVEIYSEATSVARVALYMRQHGNESPDSHSGVRAPLAPALLRWPSLSYSSQTSTCWPFSSS